MSQRVCWAAVGDGGVVALHHGDLTAEEVDAIVNAANGHLSHGGGVAAAIVRRGGGSIQAESDAWVRSHGVVPTGGVALTGAGRLPCRAVIHAVGPVWHGGGQHEEELLAQAARGSFELAAQEGFGSLALPAISSGIFGFPKDRCAEILLAEGVGFLTAQPVSPLREIRYTNFDEPTVSVFRAAFQARFGAELREGD